MVMAGADLVSLPQDAQANDACPTSFPAVQQFSGLPSLNPGNSSTGIDPNVSPNGSSSSSHGPSAGVIAGAVIAAVGATAFIVLGGLYLLRKHRGVAPAGGAPRGILPLNLVNQLQGRQDAAVVQGDAPNFRRTARAGRSSRSNTARNADDTESLRRSRSSRIPVRPASIAESTVTGHEDLEQGFELQPVNAREMV
jgi:hypothetical protein